ncbi:sigma-70 family RNA polymerase sigma factor [Geodermatophilus sp. DF01-2]|uniref:sigma-70 family RNA polymerase sigma factor n=1 Tax=Geodermatophilus sp. DF01-2 TaxID=2559610 RepID=UPI00107497F4|nr:sigma-70 family RNA polymerase sigma factor [Geodermatophilus sp. DF01_2]TFV62048.1 sigma-70 family RNA polymerase sigma factor [Geodermatophilus sp. DF01_2]
MGFSVFAAEQTDLGVYPGTLLAEARAAALVDSPAMNELLKRYEPLIKSVVRRMERPASVFDDLVNGGRWGLVQAVLHHDGRRDGFTSYLMRYVRGEAERAVERHHVPEVPVPSDDLPEVESSIYLPGSADEEEIFFDTLSSEQNVLVLARYRDDKSLAEIAKRHGCSVSAVSQRLKTIHKKLAENYVQARSLVARPAAAHPRTPTQGTRERCAAANETGAAEVRRPSTAPPACRLSTPLSKQLVIGNAHLPSRQVR